MPRVLIVGQPKYYRPHTHFGKRLHNYKKFLRRPKSVSLVVFTGGADLHPSMYGNKEIHPRTFASTYRDAIDLKVYKMTQKEGIPCVGICRGGQFLNIMAGGFLFQHVTNHAGLMHHLATIDGKKIEVTSSHHQMFGTPLPKKSQLLAWSYYNLSEVYHNGRSKSPAKKPDIEPEVVFHPHINALSVQYHPEWMKKSSEGYKYYQKLLETYIVPLTKVKKIRQKIRTQVHA